jgi:hypothetical protein
MGLVSGYDNDVFISYSHIDNKPFGDTRSDRRVRWVDAFHELLQSLVGFRVGGPTRSGATGA